MVSFIHSVASLKYRLSRLLFVATFTFHRQYFRAIWRVESLNKKKISQNVSKYRLHSMLRYRTISTFPQSHSTCFPSVDFFLSHSLAIFFFPFHMNRMNLLLFSWMTGRNRITFVKSQNVPDLAFEIVVPFPSPFNWMIFR